MKKEINPTVAIIVIVLIVAVVGILGYQKVTARQVDSWETTPQAVKDKIGQAYGVRPTSPSGTSAPSGR